MPHKTQTSPGCRSDRTSSACGSRDVEVYGQEEFYGPQMGAGKQEISRRSSNTYYLPNIEDPCVLCAP